MKLVTVDEMRDLERRSEEAGVSLDALMEASGLAIALVVWEALEGTDDRSSVVVLVGPGNNGGDGLVTARLLREGGASVTAYLCSARRPGDDKLALCEDGGVAIVRADADPARARLATLLADAHVVVDAVLGTGRSRPIGGDLSETLSALRQERLRRASLFIVAVDLPSGADADSGAMDGAGVVADVTVALGCPKTGLLRFPTAEHVGLLRVADIGIPQQLLAPLRIEVVTADWAASHLPHRRADAHKGTFGRLMVLAGSLSYVGAAYLACGGAARSGVGYVTLAAVRSLQALLVGKLTEATYLLLPEAPTGLPARKAVDTLRTALGRYDVFLAGCGLGQHPLVAALVRDLLVEGPALDTPTVLDADGLTLLTHFPAWWEGLSAQTVLTPHPGEMATLLGVGVAEVEEDRIATAREAAARWGVTVLLKGAYSVVASPEGSARVIPFANPGLATAGTGDVLAGVVAGLVAQGLSVFDAASLGAFLHAAAGELVVRELGDAGVVASDLLPRLPLAIQALKEGRFVGGPQGAP